MKNDTLKSWAYVSIQAMLLFALVLLPAHSGSLPSAVYIVGRVAQIVGVVILIVSLYDLRKSLTALPIPKKNGELQIHGLYRYVRHPMYTGVLLLSLGIAVVSGSLIQYAIVAGLWVLFNSKARYEEQLLIRTYAGYQSYMKRTPRFIPRLRRD